MATSIKILTTNYSGQTATITFSPCSGGTINLGSHVIPYDYISENYMGDYSLLFADFSQTCTFSIPCTTGATPTPTVIVATATPTPNPTSTPTDTPLPATETPTPTATPTPLPVNNILANVIFYQTAEGKLRGFFTSNSDYNVTDDVIIQWYLTLQTTTGTINIPDAGFFQSNLLTSNNTSTGNFYTDPNINYNDVIQSGTTLGTIEVVSPTSGTGLNNYTVSWESFGFNSGLPPDVTSTPTPLPATSTPTPTPIISGTTTPTPTVVSYSYQIDISGHFLNPYDACLNQTVNYTVYTAYPTLNVGDILYTNSNLTSEYGAGIGNYFIIEDGINKFVIDSDVNGFGINSITNCVDVFAPTPTPTPEPTSTPTDTPTPTPVFYTFDSTDFLRETAYEACQDNFERNAYSNVQFISGVTTGSTIFYQDSNLTNPITSFVGSVLWIKMRDVSNNIFVISVDSNGYVIVTNECNLVVGPTETPTPTPTNVPTSTPTPTPTPPTLSMGFSSAYETCDNLNTYINILGGGNFLSGSTLCDSTGFELSTYDANTFFGDGSGWFSDGTNSRAGTKTGGIFTFTNDCESCSAAVPPTPTPTPTPTSTPIPTCYLYVVSADDGTSNRDPYNFYYTRCDGTPASGSRVNNGPSITVCAREGSVYGDGPINISEEGAVCGSDPTQVPTNVPTLEPTNVPTQVPTNVPTLEPTATPPPTPHPTVTQAPPPPTDTPTPTPTPCPPADQFISSYCDGTTLMGIYTNGICGTGTQVMQYNSPQCGYETSTPTPEPTNTPTPTPLPDGVLSFSSSDNSEQPCGVGYGPNDYEYYRTYQVDFTSPRSMNGYVVVYLSDSTNISLSFNQNDTAASTSVFCGCGSPCADMIGVSNILYTTSTPTPEPPPPTNPPQECWSADGSSTIYSSQQECMDAEGGPCGQVACP